MSLLSRNVGPKSFQWTLYIPHETLDQNQQLFTLGNQLWPISLCYRCEQYFNCPFRLILADSKVKYKIWESLETALGILQFVSPYFCDALTMAAASLCSTAIYQGTDQGGVWMKQHEVTECSIGSIDIYQCGSKDGRWTSLAFFMWHFTLNQMLHSSYFMFSS